MAVPDLLDVLAPARCAIVNMECQQNLLGPQSVLPVLAQAAHDIDLLSTLQRLFDAAREVGVRIFYCTDNRRPDGFGLADNMPIRARMVGGYANVGGHGPIMDQIAPQPADVIFSREQGVTAFFATGLDQYLRNTRVKTVIITGISLNLAVLGTTVEAANRGYDVVVPTDGVAGVPAEYVSMAMRYTIANIAHVVTSEAILERWRMRRPPSDPS